MISFENIQNYRAMKKNRISVHFDGPIADGHAVQLRTFTKTLSHLQTAIDRAYLDVKYGRIWKNARLHDEDYAPTEFLMDQTREGGFIADLLGSSAKSGTIVKRIQSALEPAYSRATAEASVVNENLVDQAEERRKMQKAGAQIAMPYAEFVENLDVKQTRAYGDRSIVKEFDQVASAIRARGGDGSYVEIDLYAENGSAKFVFDDSISSAFHNVVSTRTLGDPIEIPVTLRGLDSGKGGISKAIAQNVVSKKEFSLFVHTDRGFASLRKFLKKRNPPCFSIVACPVLEYGAYDPSAGDMYFLSISKEPE